MRLASGHAANHLSGEELKKQLKFFEGYSSVGLVRLTPGRWLLPTTYLKYADKLYNTKFRSSDVVVMTYPKCGTTWMQEIVWTMRNNPDLNNPMASLSSGARCPFFDMDMLLNMSTGGSADGIKVMTDFIKGQGIEPREEIAMQLTSISPNPRTIKTHLPLSLLTPDLLDTAKVVYVARNPNDLCMSYYHHSRLIPAHGYTGTLDQFTQLLASDDLIYSPYWEHVKEAWLKKDHPNMHFVFYEDLKADTMGELRKLNDFLGSSLSEKQLQNVAHHTSFSEMKVREEPKMQIAPGMFNNEVLKKDGGFFRKGEAGGWKKSLTPIQQAKLELWTKRNTLKMGIRFKYNV